MVRFPWSSKKKEPTKDETITSHEHNRQDPEVQAIGYGRLWEEKGFLERREERFQSSLDKTDVDHFSDTIGPMDDRTLTEHDRLFGDEFHDRYAKKAVFDLFERDWGTEARVHVWWAGWDDVRVTTSGSCFLVEVDLGPSREFNVTPTQIMRKGGRYYVYFDSKTFDLSEPEMRLRDEILHLLFEGIEFPSRSYGISYGSDYERSGRELIAHIQERSW